MNWGPTPLQRLLWQRLRRPRHGRCRKPGRRVVAPRRAHHPPDDLRGVDREPPRRRTSGPHEGAGGEPHLRRPSPQTNVLSQTCRAILCPVVSIRDQTALPATPARSEPAIEEDTASWGNVLVCVGGGIQFHVLSERRVASATRST